MQIWPRKSGGAYALVLALWVAISLTPAFAQTSSTRHEAAAGLPIFIPENPFLSDEPMGDEPEEEVPDLGALSLRLPIHSFPSSRSSQAWDAAGIDLWDLDAYFYGRFSATSAERNHIASPQLRFVANVNLVAALLFYTQNRYTIRLDGEVIDRPVGEQPFRPFLVIPNRGARRSFLARLPEQNSWIQQLQALSDQIPAQDALQRIYEFAKANLVQESSATVRQAVGTALNAWYQTFDPHARVLSGLAEVRPSQPRSFAEQLEALHNSFVPNPWDLKVAYLRIESFFDASSALVELIRRNEEAGAELYIIDVRGNPGGLVQDLFRVLNALVVSSQPTELFYVTRSRDQAVLDRFFSFRQGDTQKPIIVLQDASTKSTAEIFSGSLQFHGRAWILGDVSFGKAGYLEARPILDNRLLLYETTKVLHLPDGFSPQLTGIIPDFFVGVDPSAPRMATRYPNPLPREPRIFNQTRSAQIQVLNRCANIRHSRDQATIRSMLSQTPQSNDYLIVRSLLIASCLLRSP